MPKPTLDPEIILNARLWKDVTINHMNLNEKKWERYYHELKESGAVKLLHLPEDRS